MLSLEFEDYYFTTVYTPNAVDGLKRLAERQEWDKFYANYLTDLDKNKPVIATGDFNVAHKEIDYFLVIDRIKDQVVEYKNSKLWRQIRPHSNPIRNRNLISKTNDDKSQIKEISTFQNLSLF